MSHISQVNIPNINLPDIAERLVNQYGVLILPGENFPITDSVKNDISSHFRIGFARKNFPEVLSRFEECFPLVLESVGVDVSQYW